MPNFSDWEGVDWGREDNFSMGVRSTDDLLRRITTQDWYCPHCSHKLQLKSTKDGSRKFWGCTDYPTCHFSCSELDVARIGLNGQENASNTPNVQLKRRHGSIVHMRRSMQKRQIELATPESQRIITGTDRSFVQESEGSEIQVMKDTIKVMQARIERLEKELQHIEKRRQAAGFEIDD